MKLDPEGVEKAVEGFYRALDNGSLTHGAVINALTAYFDHLKSEGLMTTEEREEALVIDGKAELVETTTYAIIRTDKD